MDLLSRIASWLGENEATISAVVGIAVLAGIVFAGLRSVVRRRAETSAETAPADAEAPSATDSSPPDLDPLTVPGFEGRPAIAVLPFDNLSGDPEQEYFADGIAEDLITRLSHWREFPVIARNSTFTYKGRAVDVKQVCRELGARYVVEGSVRRSDGRVRIAAQLIDATTGTHVWAETYDRELRDIFALQDEITEAVVASMYPGLRRFEQEQASRRQPQNLDAWDSMHRGWWHTFKNTKSDNAKARLFFERAAKLDPHFADAFAGLALIHHNDILQQWTDSVAQSTEEMDRAARKSIELDDEHYGSHLSLGLASSLKGQRNKAIAALELAVQLNPSAPLAYQALGFWLAMTARTDEAIEKLQKGMRLSPHDPGMFFSFYGMALAHFGAGRYEEAIDAAQQSLQRRPNFPPCYRVVAASQAHLGRVSEARAAVEELRRVEPAFSVAAWEQSRPDIDAGLLQLFLDGLRKAGLPE